MTTEAIARPNGAHRTIEDTGLAVRETSSGELAPTGAAAQAQYEIQSAIVIARKFPRNEDEAFAKLMKACARTSFAEDASYKFPRGGESVDGPSVNLAREGARVWGNIRYGLDIIRDDADSRQVRGWAWDLETNVKVTAEDDFAKLVYRKSKGWVKPDERDLRELTNRRGSILIRNCILQLLPKDLIEDARAAAAETLKTEAKRDPDAARKKIIVAFSQVNISPSMLEEYLGCSLASASPDQISKLREVFVSIRDGNSTWSDYVGKAPSEGPKVSDLDSFAGTSAAPASPVVPEAAASPSSEPALISPERAKAIRELAAERGLDADVVAAEISGAGLESTPVGFETTILRAIDAAPKSKAPKKS